MMDGAAADKEFSLRTGRPGTAGTACGRRGPGAFAGAGGNEWGSEGGNSWKIGAGEGRGGGGGGAALGFSVSGIGRGAGILLGKFCFGFVTGGEIMFLLILLKSKLRLKAGDTVLSCSGGWGRISLAGWGWGWGLETSL